MVFISSERGEREGVSFGERGLWSGHALNLECGDVIDNFLGSARDPASKVNVRAYLKPWQSWGLGIPSMLMLYKRDSQQSWFLLWCLEHGVCFSPLAVSAVRRPFQIIWQSRLVHVV